MPLKIEIKENIIYLLPLSIITNTNLLEAVQRRHGVVPLPGDGHGGPGVEEAGVRVGGVHEHHGGHPHPRPGHGGGAQQRQRVLGIQCHRGLTVTYYIKHLNIKLYIPL